jgi:hypothetical protein
MSSTPTREEFLANLSPVPVDQCATIDEDTTCIICTNDPVDSLFDAEDEFAVVLHERHVFGERCIREWLSENNTCPKCRAVLFEADEDDSEYDTDDEMEDDDDEDTITAAEFEMILAEEDFEVAVSHGLLDSGARVARFRRDFCRLFGMFAGEEEAGGQLDETPWNCTSIVLLSRTSIRRSSLWLCSMILPKARCRRISTRTSCL